MSDINNLKLAVLIDADNAQASSIESLMNEISHFGTVHVKRIYGDWTKPNLKQWKEELHKHAIQPIQQFSYTNGKNSTDSALIIDAMDLLHLNHLDGFCLVSSDSDFTRLATRIRENGLVVYGFGEKKTPQAFTSACDQFIFIENLTRNLEEIASNKAKTGDAKNNNLSDDEKLKKYFKSAIDALSKDSEWAPLSLVGASILKINPSFDSRNYGYPKLGELVQDLTYLEVEKRKTDNMTKVYHIYKTQMI